MQPSSRRRLGVLLSQLDPGPAAGTGGISFERIQGSTGGAVVRGVSLEHLSDEDAEKIRKAFLEHGFLVFPNQHGLSKPAYKAFGERFGTIEFDNQPVSNAKKDGSLVPDMGVTRGNNTHAWHCGSTYKPQSSKAAMLYAEVVPPSGGGETEFADMREAYAKLDAPMQAKIENLCAYHSNKYSMLRRTGYEPQKEVPLDSVNHRHGAYLRPLVKLHPETGRKSIFAPSHAFGIPGMAPEESEKFLDDLIEFACQPPRTYKHKWVPGDLVVWDNRCFMHRARPYDPKEQRTLIGTRIAGEPDSETALPGGHGTEMLALHMERLRQTKQWVGAENRLR